MRLRWIWELLLQVFRPSEPAQTVRSKRATLLQHGWLAVHEMGIDGLPQPIPDQLGWWKGHQKRVWRFKLSSLDHDTHFHGGMFMVVAPADALAIQVALSDGGECWMSDKNLVLERVEADILLEHLVPYPGSWARAAKYLGVEPLRQSG